MSEGIKALFKGYYPCLNFYVLAVFLAQAMSDTTQNFCLF